MGFRVVVAVRVRERVRATAIESGIFGLALDLDFNCWMDSYLVWMSVEDGNRGVYSEVDIGGYGSS